MQADGDMCWGSFCISGSGQAGIEQQRGGVGSGEGESGQNQNFQVQGFFIDKKTYKKRVNEKKYVLIIQALVWREDDAVWDYI